MSISLRESGYTFKATPEKRQEALDKAVERHGTQAVLQRLEELYDLNDHRPDFQKKIKVDLTYIQAFEHPHQVASQVYEQAIQTTLQLIDKLIKDRARMDQEDYWTRLDHFVALLKAQATVLALV